jgi:hypothetical protein
VVRILLDFVGFPELAVAAGESKLQIGNHSCAVFNGSESGKQVTGIYCVLVKCCNFDKSCFCFSF